MDQTFVKLCDGQVVCAISECFTALSFNVLSALQHFKASHPSSVAATRTFLTIALQQLSLKLFVYDNGHVVCTACNVPLATSAVSSVQLHLKSLHNLRGVPEKDIASHLQGLFNDQPLSFQRLDLLSSRILALYCTNDSCDFAVSLAANTKARAHQLLYQHLRKHGSDQFDGSMTLVNRAEHAEIGYAYSFFQGKRCRKDTSFPTGVIDIDVTTSTPTHVTSASPPLASSSSVPSVLSSSTSMSTNSPTITQPLDTPSTQHIPHRSASHVTLSSSSRRRLFDSVPSSSTPSLMRDEQLQLALFSTSARDTLSTPVALSDGLKLSTEAIERASQLYYTIEWWVTDLWYATICIEGALTWYTWAQEATPTVDRQPASKETLLQGSLHLIQDAITFAKLGRMIHPAMSGALSSHNANIQDQDEASMPVNTRHGISVISEGTRLRYAKVLVRALQYLNNKCHEQHSLYLFPADMNSARVEQNSASLFQALVKLEWNLDTVSGHKLGTFSQVVAALCLKDTRVPALQSDGTTLLAHLGLVPASEVAATCSALMYVLKCLVLVNRRYPHFTGTSLLFDTSRSGSQLAAVKLNYDNLPETELAFQRLLWFDSKESLKRQSPVFMYTPTASGQGTFYIGVDEISAAVMHATAMNNSTLNEFLILVGADAQLCTRLTNISTDLTFSSHLRDLGRFDFTQAPHASSGDSDLPTEDLGQHITRITKAFLDSHSDELQLQQRLQKLLHRLEDVLIFLVHVTSGAPGRANDLLDLMLHPHATSGTIKAVSNKTLHIDALVHKVSDHQHQKSRRVSRFPTYATSKLLVIHVAIVRGIHPNHSNLWSPAITDEMAIVRSFNRAATECFRIPFQFNIWRHLLQLLIAKGHQTLQQCSTALRYPGEQSMSDVQHEQASSVGLPAVSNVLTLQFAHSIATAITSYKTKDLNVDEWRHASLSLQKFLKLHGIYPTDQRETPISNNEFPSLFPVTCNGDDERECFVRDVLRDAYSSFGPERQPSALQTSMVHNTFLGTSDVVVVGTCGIGKSAAYLTAGLAASKKGWCILLLCPQNNVALCAQEMCQSASIANHRLQNDQASHDFVKKIHETNGTALDVSVIITTFVVASESKDFDVLLRILTQGNLLARVIVDEVHICLSSYHWRLCFNACGNLQSRIGYSVPWTYTTATLPEVAMAPYVSFWHIGLRQQTIVRSPTCVPDNVRIYVQKVPPMSVPLHHLQKLLRRWFQVEPNKWLARRAMILVLQVAEAVALVAELKGTMATIGLHPADDIVCVHSDTSNDETLQAIKQAKLIVCTTALSSSMNIKSMDAVVIYKTTYSLNDLVQAWGRVGREGQRAEAALLWAPGAHNHNFGQSETTWESACLSWASSHRKLHGRLRSTFAPNGVKQFAESTLCRRVLIGKAYDDDKSTALDCLSVDFQHTQHQHHLCDNCESDVLGTDNITFGDDDDDDDDEDHRRNETSKSVSQTSASVAKPSNTERDDDDDLIASVLWPDHDRPTDDTAAMANNIFSKLETMLEERAGLGGPAHCFMCRGASCQGIRDDKLSRACTGREVISTYRHNFVCYGCGGSHSRDACTFRGPNQQPPVPKDLHRCFQCYLPQQAQGSISFHPTERHTSGKGTGCVPRGKVLFGLLTSAFSCKPDIIKDFIESCSAFMLAPPPQAASTNRFSDYWEWIWQLSPLRYQVLHLDIWLLFLLEKCS